MTTAKDLLDSVIASLNKVAEWNSDGHVEQYVNDAIDDTKQAARVIGIELECHRTEERR